jgi:F0F1-type ATP synthase membrane subunit b/b'
MPPSPNIEDRRRAHVERMLQRAEKRSRRAQKLVEKWKAKLMELDRKGIAAKQALLWQEEHL